MMSVAGVDGCRTGWVVVHDGHAAVRADFLGVLAALPDDAIIAVDIPIGLGDSYERGGRECDRLARARLGEPRGTSVFPAPPRPALAARSLPAARSLGWPATRQGLNIAEKIAEVDHAMTRSIQERVFEVHPELSFAELNGGLAVLSNKRRRTGRDERWALLEQVGEARPKRPRAGEAEDDLLDACAAAWSARRIARNRDGCLPVDPPRDARGLRMEIRW
jgi:predicted RNase H-like nuclease